MKQHDIASKFRAAAECLGLLSLWESIYCRGPAANQQQVDDDLTRFREAASKAQKQLARKHHPDLGGDLETMQRINEAWNFIKELKIELRPPPPPPQHFIQVIFCNVGGFSSNASTTTTTGFTTSWGATGSF